MSHVILFFFIKGSDNVTIPIYLTFFNFKILNFEILAVSGIAEDSNYLV